MFRVELKMFTRFEFKLVFRVSDRSVACDKPVPSKHTDVHNCQVLSAKAYLLINDV